MRIRLWRGYPIVKPVMRWDSTQHIYRLFRVFSNCNSKGYSWMWSLALSPTRPFVFKKEFDGFFLTVLCVRLHYKRSYGGNFV